MSKNNLNENEFKVVTYKRNRTKTDSDVQVRCVIEPVPSKYFDLEAALRRIHAAKEDLLATDLYSSVLASLRESLQLLHTSEVKEIVCFGLGRIDIWRFETYIFQR